MLSGFSFIAPFCYHVPLKVKEFEINCEENQYLSVDNTTVGVVDNAAVDYINEYNKTLDYKDNEYSHLGITIKRETD